MYDHYKEVYTNRMVFRGCVLTEWNQEEWLNSSSTPKRIEKQVELNKQGSP